MPRIRARVAIPVVLTALGVGGGVATQRSCSDRECARLEAAAQAACQVDPASPACKAAQAAYEQACVPQPTPTPSPSPEPTPEPTPTPTPSPSPTPPPGDCQVPPDEGWTAVEPDPGPYPGLLAKIREAQAAVEAETGSRCGKPSGLSLILLVDKLSQWGVCSAGFGADMLMIRRPDAPRFEEWDVVLANGCWSQQWSYTWLPPGEAPPAPTDCDPPMPLRTYADGTPHWRLDGKPQGSIVDHTPTYLDTWDPSSGSCKICTAYGYGQIGGQPRCTCPLGLDGTTARLCREDWIGGGWRVESRNGAHCEQVSDNPLWLIPQGGNCRLCSVLEPAVCGGWF